MSISIGLVVTYIIGFFLILVGVSFIFGIEDELMAAPGRIADSLAYTVSGVFGGGGPVEIKDATYDVKRFGTLVEECWTRGNEEKEDQLCFVLVGAFPFTETELKEELGEVMAGRVSIESDFQGTRVAITYNFERNMVAVTG